jgi:hypothetical protein
LEKSFVSHGNDLIQVYERQEYLIRETLLKDGAGDLMCETPKVPAVFWQDNGT